MKLKIYPIISFILILLSACEPKQPVFTSAYGLATPVPLRGDSPKVAANISARIRSFSISPDSKSIALATSQGVIVYDLRTYKHLQTLNPKESFYLIDWSPDGIHLAADGLAPSGSKLWKTHLAVWDTSTWKIVFEQMGKDDSQNVMYGDVAWSPDGHSLANTVNDMDVFVYDFAKHEIVSRQKNISSRSISWSPDGSRLVSTGDEANSIRRWRVDTGESIRLFDARAGSPMLAVWSPDGKRIASGQAEGTVCFWTASTNQCDGFIRRAHRNAVFSLAWSPNGSQLATGCGVIRIWDSKTGSLIKSFGESETSIYTHLVWLGANQTLVSAETGYADSALNVVRFWDADRGQELFEFRSAPGLWGE